MTPPDTGPPGPDSYPCLRGRPPILARGPGEVQIGVDQESLVLIDVHPDLRQLLALLDGRHSLAEIRSAAVRLGIGLGHLDWCLRRLREAELVVEVPRVRSTADVRPRRVRLVGAGRLGRQVARTLVDSCVTDLYLIDDQPPDPALYPGGRAWGSQADALASEWGAWDGIRVRVLNHWSKPDGCEPDLTIVAGNQMECDRVVADGLLRADQPHLLVRAGGSGVVVGPFVVPGRTACLHCTDLTRTDADHAWPTLLPQLLRARATPTTTQISWAGSVAAAQALAFLHGSVPETYGATLELGVADHLTRWRSWPMHPSCGCGWGHPADWGA